MAAEKNLDKNANEGEGSRSGARQYDDGATRHAKAGESDRAARQAARDLDDPATKRDLAQAEKVGRERTKEEDRLLREPAATRPKSGDHGPGGR